MKPREIKVLERICEEAKAQGQLSQIHLYTLSKGFGKRFTKALEALKEERIKKYVFRPSGRIVWIVVGRERDYLVIPSVNFCSCDDFYFRVMDRQAHLCYHLIAQRLAEALSCHDKIGENDDIYDSLMKEWKEVSP